MLKKPEEVRSIEEAYDTRLYGNLSFPEKLHRYEALLDHVRSLNPAFTEHWRQDLEADLAIARLLNELPSEA